MAPIALLMVGNELLDGRVLDTNSQFLSSHFSQKGIEVGAILSCRDGINEICDALRFLSQKHKVIITSGGLGPTTDDLTREAVSEHAGVELENRPELVQRLEKWFLDRGRTFDPSNLKQASIPKGSKIIPNDQGTAVGFQLTTNDDVTIFSLPGVPRELHHLFFETVLPACEKELGLGTSLQNVGLRVYGLGESVVGSIIQSLNFSPDITISYLASFPEVKVLFTAARDLSKEQHQAVEALGNDVVFTTEYHKGFAEVVHELLLSKGVTVGLAESCTGGLVSALLTDYSGASMYLRGSIVCYSNEVKQGLLAVSDDTLKNEGAVSHDTVLKLAEEAKRVLYSSIGISISGIAGPEGGTEAKPVGTFFIGFSNETETKSYKFFFSGSRDRIRKYSAYKALDVLRRELLKLDPPRDALETREVLRRKDTAS